MEIHSLQQETYLLQGELERILSASELNPIHLNLLLSMLEEIEFLFIKLGLYGNELFHMGSEDPDNAQYPAW